MCEFSIEKLDKLRSQINTLQKEKDSIKRRNELSSENMISLQKTKSFRADLLLRLENLQSEIRTLSTGVEEYKEFLKKPSKEMDRVKADIEGRLKILEERGKIFEEKNQSARREKIKELEDHLKGLEGKIAAVASKQIELEKLISTKEVPAEIKGISTGMGDLYKDAYETFQRET